MLNSLDRRIAKIEKRVAESTSKPNFCNCKITTRFHDADCLAAILRGTSRVCAVHGFRQLGFFFWTPKWYRLLREDGQLCPCSRHPWRSFVTGEGPRGWEASYAARKAWLNLPPEPKGDLQEENRRSNRHAAGDYAERLPILDNVIAVRETVARLIADVYDGKLNPRIAAGLAPLLNLQLRVIEATIWSADSQK